MLMLLFQEWLCKNIVLGKLSDEYRAAYSNLGDILILLKPFCGIGHGSPFAKPSLNIFDEDIYSEV